jgi:hypothetical protein
VKTGIGWPKHDETLQDLSFDLQEMARSSMFAAEIDPGTLIDQRLQGEVKLRLQTWYPKLTQHCEKLIHLGEHECIAIIDKSRTFMSFLLRNVVVCTG